MHLGFEWQGRGWRDQAFVRWGAIWSSMSFMYSVVETKSALVGEIDGVKQRRGYRVESSSV